ncbi:MAG: hypothetical protein IKU17_06790 [Clostridia bacterium]|nr:hypothetical protein [Clostridia bacterium]
MKKFLLFCGCVLALLLGGAALLYTNLTAETAPALPREELDSALTGQVARAVLTGEEVALTQGQLNALLDLLPAEYSQNLLGMELTGENTGALWGRTELFGSTCHLRGELRFSFEPETAALCCTIEKLQIGRVTVPEKLVPLLLEEYLHGLDFSGKSIIIKGNDIARAALHTEAAVIQNLRCDETAVYLTPADAGSLLGYFMGKNF